MSSEGLRVGEAGVVGVVGDRVSRHGRRRRGVRGIAARGRGVKGRGLRVREVKGRGVRERGEVKDFGVVREAGVGPGRSDRRCAGGGVGVFEVD
jgi:hypothetical protein